MLLNKLPEPLKKLALIKLAPVIFPPDPPPDWIVPVVNTPVAASKDNAVFDASA